MSTLPSTTQHMLMKELESVELWNNLKDRDDVDLQTWTARQFKELLLSQWSLIGSEKEWDLLLRSLDERLKSCVFSTLPHEIIGGILLIGELIALIVEIASASNNHKMYVTQVDRDDKQSSSSTFLQESFLRYATYLREILTKCNGHDDKLKKDTICVIALCTQTLGALVVPRSGDLAKRIVENDVKLAVRWMRAPYSREVSVQHKIAAVWMLQEYARSVPLLFTVWIKEQIKESIMSAIGDRDLTVRTGGCRVLLQCLQAMSKWPSRDQTNFHTHIITDSEHHLNLASPPVHVLHGALLSFQCLLDYCMRYGEDIPYLTEHFRKLCDASFEQRAHKRGEIKLCVIQLMPLFARYDAATFIKCGFLERAMEHLIGVAHEVNKQSAHSKTHKQTKKIRKHALMACGRLALIVGTKLLAHTVSASHGSHGAHAPGGGGGGRGGKHRNAKHTAAAAAASNSSSRTSGDRVRRLMAVIEQSLDIAVERTRNGKPWLAYVKPALRCTSMLATALGAEFAPFLHAKVIAKILRLGLTKCVVRCIQKIYDNVSHLQPLIQQRLSRMVWLVLFYNTHVAAAAAAATNTMTNNHTASSSSGGGGDTVSESAAHAHHSMEDSVHHHAAQSSTATFALNGHGHGHGGGVGSATVVLDDVKDDEFSTIHGLAMPDDGLLLYDHQHHDTDSLLYDVVDHEMLVDNLMFYHYKQHNYVLQQSPANYIAITATEYFSAVAHAHDAHDHGELPPFVSPPIMNSLPPFLIPRGGGGRGASSSVSRKNTADYDDDKHARRRSSAYHHHTYASAAAAAAAAANIPGIDDKQLRNPALIELALQTMAQFDLKDVNINLLFFVRETVLFYCTHPQAAIRKQAGMTCCALLSRIIEQMHKEEEHLKMHWVEIHDRNTMAPAANNMSVLSPGVPAASSLAAAMSAQSIGTPATATQTPLITVQPPIAMELPQHSIVSSVSDASPLWTVSLGNLSQFVDEHSIAATATLQQQQQSNRRRHQHHNEPEQAQAAPGSSTMMTCDGYHMQLSGQHLHQSSIICNVLAKLLSFAIADTEIDIRQQLLLSLYENTRFYPFLARQELLASLFIVLNAEHFAVRQIALKLLGSLATYNPAHIMPFIRKHLLELLTYLDNRSSSMGSHLIHQQKQEISNRRESAELIGDLIESASIVTMKPYQYVHRIMVVLLKQLKLGDNINVEISMLRTIGKLAKVSAQNILKQYFSKLVPILVTILSETSEAIKRSHIKFVNNNESRVTGSPKHSENEREQLEQAQTQQAPTHYYKNMNAALIAKKCVTLQTLGHIVESTGLVIQPYLMYKKLLKIVLNSLKSDQNVTVRREAIQILGIIGALDPQIHRQNLKQLEYQQQLKKKLQKNKSKIHQQAKSPTTTNPKKTAERMMMMIGHGGGGAGDNVNNDEFYDEEESDFLSESNILLMTGSSDPQFFAYVALRSLILIVHESSLHKYHREALSNINKIFFFFRRNKNLTECIPYLQNVIPPILGNLKKSSDPSQRAMILQQLAKLINIVHTHIRTYLGKIFELIHTLWDENAYLLYVTNAIRSQRTLQLQQQSSPLSSTRSTTVSMAHAHAAASSSSAAAAQQNAAHVGNIYQGYHPSYQHPSSNLNNMQHMNGMPQLHSTASGEHKLDVRETSFSAYELMRTRSDSFGGPFGYSYVHHLPSMAGGGGSGGASGTSPLPPLSSTSSQNVAMLPLAMRPSLSYQHSGGGGASSNLNLHHSSGGSFSELHPLSSMMGTKSAPMSNLSSESGLKQHYELQDQLLYVQMEICKAIQDEFKQYLRKLLPKILFVLRKENYLKNINERCIISALHSLTIFGSNLQDFLFLALPPILELIRSTEISLPIRTKAIECIGRLSTKCDFSAYTSRIIHPLTAVLQSATTATTAASSSSSASSASSLYNATMGTLCLLMIQMGADYLIFAPIIERILVKHRKHHPTYHNLLHRLHLQNGHIILSEHALQRLTQQLYNEKLSLSTSSSTQAVGDMSSFPYHAELPMSPSLRGALRSGGDDKDDVSQQSMDQIHSLPSTLSHGGVGAGDLPDESGADDELGSLRDDDSLKVAEVMLRKAWDVRGRAAERDWYSWLHEFQVELLAQTPRRELRVCSSLAQKYKGLATNLFNAAFLSCWLKLDDSSQNHCHSNIKHVITTRKAVPAMVKNTLLKLVEFMQRQNCSVWISIPDLSLVAEKSHSYSDALYYKEQQFRLACLDDLNRSNVSQRASHKGTHKLNGGGGGVGGHGGGGAGAFGAGSGYGGKGSLGQHQTNNHLAKYKKRKSRKKYYVDINEEMMAHRLDTSYAITAESLLTINNQLQQKEAAEGILRFTQIHKPAIQIKPTWFEKLSRWEDALDAYSKVHLECLLDTYSSENIAASLGRMRCLQALGEWDRLYKLATDSFSDIDQEMSRLKNSQRLHHKIMNRNADNKFNYAAVACVTPTSLSQQQPQPQRHIKSKSTNLSARETPTLQRRKTPSGLQARPHAQTNSTSVQNLHIDINPQQNLHINGVNIGNLGSPVSDGDGGSSPPQNDVAETRSSFELIYSPRENENHLRQRSGFNEETARTKHEAPKSKPLPYRWSENKKERESKLLQFEREVAPLGAVACWNLGEWDKMKMFVKKINAHNNFEGAFLRSILNVHDNQREDALYWIEKCREFLDEQFTNVIVDDYENMYPLCIKAQQLIELEETLLYKEAKQSRDSLKCRELEKMWKRRLKFLQNSVEVWQSILSVRQLVITPRDDVDTWLKFNSLCRKSNRLSMSLKIIANLMGYHNENILFYHQMYYDHSKRNKGNNFVRWAPSLQHSGSASHLHAYLNDTLTFPLGVRRVTAPQIQTFERILQRQENDLHDATFDLEDEDVIVTTLADAADDDYSVLSPMTFHASNNNSNQLYIPTPTSSSARQPLSADVNSLTAAASNASTQFKYFSELNANEPAAAEDATVAAVNMAQYKHAQPDVAFAYAKHLWCAGLKIQALAQLTGLVSYMENFLSLYETQHASISDRGNFEKYYYYHHLTASCYLRLGKLKYEGHDREYQTLSDNDIEEVLLCYQNATRHDPKSYYAWHAWALMNYQAIQHYEDKVRNRHKNSGAGDRGSSSRSSSAARDNSASTTSGDPRKNKKLLKILPTAVDALFQSIMFAQRLQSTYGDTADTKLQDVLRLLYVWFAYGDLSDVNSALQRGFEAIAVETWLSVIPQIIARLHIGKRKIGALIDSLLVRVGRAHPQALIFPLTVASQSPNPTRKRFAISLLDRIRYDEPTLVEEGEMVSTELLRVAILWHEMWHEALVQASHIWFGATPDVNAMIARLQPLYDLLPTADTAKHGGGGGKTEDAAITTTSDSVTIKLGAAHKRDRRRHKLHKYAHKKTLREQAFEDAFKSDLLAAWDLVQQYAKHGNEADMLRAWGYYRRVWEKINTQIDKLLELDLQYASPWLKHADNLQVAMPGTYGVQGDQIHIYKFNPMLTVLDTAQRPRKLTILGTDGNSYTFLLKGKEDLRQDERVMQLFGLMNRLLTASNETNKRDLEIRTYAVIPLAPNCGMIGWVSFTDTIQSLIQNYRESQQLIFGIENEFVFEESANYDELPMYNKLEIFEHVLHITKGNDLRDLFWLKSWNADIWLKKRCEYMRSLAVMSMVGYILGLGDRHPCNLMIHRYTGKVVHIDFGDCFEVAMLRDKLPEKVPFRLTRMLINAMEISGFEGNFRITCEAVMHLLREHKQSVMAVLEALAYDPLTNWRLLEQQEQEKEKREKRQQQLQEEEKEKAREAQSSSPSAAIEDSTTDHTHTPELHGLAVRRTKSRRRVTFNEDSKNNDDDDDNAERRSSSKVPFEQSRGSSKEQQPQIHQLFARSLQSKKMRSLASSLKDRDSLDTAHMAKSQTRNSGAMSYVRRPRMSSLWMPRDLDGDNNERENINKKALQVLQRVSMKLRGRDFRIDDYFGVNDSGVGDRQVLNVKEQVQRLFVQATSHENLSQHFHGWCQLW